MLIFQQERLATKGSCSKRRKVFLSNMTRQRKEKAKDIDQEARSTGGNSAYPPVSPSSVLSSESLQPNSAIQERAVSAIEKISISSCQH